MDRLTNDHIEQLTDGLQAPQAELQVVRTKEGLDPEHLQPISEVPQSTPSEMATLQETVQRQEALIARLTASVERLEDRDRQREDLLMHLQAVVERTAQEHQQHLAELQFAAPWFREIDGMRRIVFDLQRSQMENGRGIDHQELLTELRDVSARLDEQEVKNAQLQQMLINLQDAQIEYQEEVRVRQEATPPN